MVTPCLYPYRYGFNGKEKDNEIEGEGNDINFGAREYDPRLGRWFSMDELTHKYPMHSPYLFCGGNPILFTDVDGRDWFVNTKTGDVLYIKNEKQTSAEAFKRIGYTAGNPNDFERLGPNDMFGDKVSKNDLARKAFFVDNSESWMENKGYFKAEKVTIKEEEYTSGGRMGPDENITQVDGFIKQIGGSKITYAKEKELNTSKFGIHLKQTQ